MSTPRLVLAAASSGAGKTTVATGLMAALRARGLAVSPHKVGPDYIDPGYHALATGRPGRNLDPVLVGEHRVVPLFLHGSRSADVAVVEGVMGLFDGRGAGDEGSTAHVARLLDAPVVLVVDASAASRSVAALVHGFTTYDPRVHLAGVVLNRVGSDRHEALLREALAPVPVLGVLRRDDAAAVPSRHLGLVPAAERAPEALAVVRRLAALVERGCDLDALLSLARSAPALPGRPWEPPVVAPPQQRPVVALAGGPAFTFSYAETAEALAAAGAEVAVVDPLRDEQLPEGTGAVVLPGGFPEVYAGQLAANTPFLAALRRHAEGPGATYAECAGLLVLCRSLDGSPMTGVLDAAAEMTPRLTLGYRDAEVLSDGLVGEAGVRVTGHEFHRTRVHPVAGERPAWRLLGQGGLALPEGHTRGGTLHASYVHLHPAGVPALAPRLVAAARARVPAGGVAVRLVGVGVGPGDPELVTVKGVRVLREAGVVVVPVMDAGDVGRAEATVRAHTDREPLRLVFALDDRGGATAARHSAWEAAAERVAAELRAGAGTVAFATLGDPNVYSTFTYLADAVRERLPEVTVETVPGITAMQDLAARSGTVLCEGTESLALLPLTAGVPVFEEALTHFDTVVAYKGGSRMPQVREVLERLGRLDGAVYGSALGLRDEAVGPARELSGQTPYLSTVIVPARRTSRGGKL